MLRGPSTWLHRRDEYSRQLDAGRPAAAGVTFPYIDLAGLAGSSRSPSRAGELGLVWRLARRFDSRVVRPNAEADLGNNVVLVFKVVGRGDTRLIFALTRGDASPTAVKSATAVIHSA